jgi:hypothetical protein
MKKNKNDLEKYSNNKKRKPFISIDQMKKDKRTKEVGWQGD